MRELRLNFFLSIRWASLMEEMERVIGPSTVLVDPLSLRYVPQHTLLVNDNDQPFSKFQYL